MKVLTYNDQKITVKRCTLHPLDIVAEAAQLTTGIEIKNRFHLIKRLLTANHTSLFEHVSITLLIENVSRSFLAQITRHRISSFTSSSQHYQNYRDYPIIIDPNLLEGKKEWFNDICEKSLTHYKNMIQYHNVDKSEARQILPNAMAVNILWTINARSLINFLNLRLCKRNVLEMVTFASLLHGYCIDWFPELFKFVGPDCIMTECKQGAMSCQKE